MTECAREHPKEVMSHLTRFPRIPRTNSKCSSLIINTDIVLYLFYVASIVFYLDLSSLLNFFRTFCNSIKKKLKIFKNMLDAATKDNMGNIFDSQIYISWQYLNKLQVSFFKNIFIVHILTSKKCSIQADICTSPHVCIFKTTSQH